MRPLIVAALMVLASGCGAETPTEPSADGVVRITGWVSDFGTDAGVSGVAVRFGETQAITDAGGAYVMSVLIGQHTVYVDGTPIGSARVNGPFYRGDLLIRGGNCVSRYGTLADARTRRPVSGATVSLAGKSTRSAPDGWYRIDLGCPQNGLVGFNTTFMTVEHPSYAARSQVVGRGVFGVVRIDLDLEPR